MNADAIIGAIENRIRHDEQQVKRVTDEMRKLSDPYNRYLDLERDLRTHERSIEKLQGLLGASLLYSIPMGDDDAKNEEKVKELRRELELWEAVEQFLRFVPEARLREIVEFLEAAGIKTSRQAIEACVQAHPKVFAARIKRRVKFLSLRQRF
jgi:hypothetical protein